MPLFVIMEVKTTVRGDRKPMTEICLVRHGETLWNREFRLQGAKDIPLSEIGIAQAQAAASRLSKENWDILYSSDLSRAKVTAEHLNLDLGIPHYIEAGLRERNFGPLEGMKREDIEQKYPNVLHHSAGEQVISGVESYEALCQRVQETIKTIACRHVGKKILIVSHGASINAFLHMVTGQRLNRIENTALTRLRYDGKNWYVDCINDCHHLQTMNKSNRIK